MGLTKAEVKELIKEAFAANEINPAEGEDIHPVRKVEEFIRTTPLKQLPHKWEQKEDGSGTLTISIPSFSDQAKQKAMQDAMQQQHNHGQPLQAKPAMPASPAEMPTPGMQEKMPAAAASNVQIRVAMSPEKAAKELKTQYPTGFLKSMGL